MKNNKNMNNLNEAITVYAEELMDTVNSNNLTITQKYVLMLDTAKTMILEQLGNYEEDWEYNTTTNSYSKVTEC